MERESNIFRSFFDMFSSNERVYPNDIRCLDHTNKIYKNVSNFYLPNQIRTVYGFSNIERKFMGRNVKVAIITAYKTKTLQRDFVSFCERFHLPHKELHIISLGNKYSEQWDFETTLDVQILHTCAPFCEILIVESKSEKEKHLFEAINIAIKNGADIVNMSWGGNESKNSINFDKIFHHDNICFIASSGDTSMKLDYPSSSPNVLSVGGTQLILDDHNNREQQLVWEQSGTGYSKIFETPSYQYGLSLRKRHTPDLCSVASPKSGVVICYKGHFYSVGGTSVSAPITSAMIACANSIRINKNKNCLSTNSTLSSCIQKIMYIDIYKNNKELYSECFYDIKKGENGIFTANDGFDLCTGLGSFNADKLIEALSIF